MELLEPIRSDMVSAMTAPRPKGVLVRLSEDVHARLRARAERERRSLSQTAALIIEDSVTVEKKE